MYNPCSENKGADQLCSSYYTADLRLSLGICKLLDLLEQRLIITTYLYNIQQIFQS